MVETESRSVNSDWDSLSIEETSSSFGGKYDREEVARKKLQWISGVQPKSEMNVKKPAPTQTLTVKQMFADPQLRKNFLVLSVMWFCAGLSMYCIDLNGEDMTKNLWVGQFSAAALASVIRVIVGFADAKFLWLGRRLVYILSMGTCIIASAALLYENINTMKGSVLYFVTYLVAYNSISVSWEPNYLGAAELMPTEVRAKATAGLNIISRISNVFAARVVGKLKGKWEPGIIIIVLASNIFSFIVTIIWLKETKNVSLEAIGKKDVEKGKEEVSTSSDATSKGSTVSRGTTISKDETKKDESKLSEEKKGGSAEKGTEETKGSSDESKLPSKETKLPPQVDEPPKVSEDKEKLQEEGARDIGEEKEAPRKGSKEEAKEVEEKEAPKKDSKEEPKEIKENEEPKPDLEKQPELAEEKGETAKQDNKEEQVADNEP